DAELASATPGGADAIDELIDIDALGLEPFTLDDEDMDFVTSVQPAAAETREQPQPIVSPPPEPGASDAPQGAEQPAEGADGGVDREDVPGLGPFAIEDFEDINADSPFEFGVLPWERAEGSANGLDIDALLGSDESEPVTPAPEPEPLFGFGESDEG